MVGNGVKVLIIVELVLYLDVFVGGDGFVYGVWCSECGLGLVG